MSKLLRRFRRRRGSKPEGGFDKIRYFGVPLVVGVVLTLSYTLVLEYMIHPKDNPIGYWAGFYIAIYGCAGGAVIDDRQDDGDYLFWVGSSGILTNVFLLMLNPILPF